MLDHGYNFWVHAKHDIASSLTMITHYFRKYEYAKLFVWKIDDMGGGGRYMLPDHPQTS